MNDQHSATQIVIFVLSLLLRVWGIYELPIACWLVRTWVRAYTHFTVSEAQEDRRLEVGSDVAEHIAALLAEGYHPSQAGARVLFRAVTGMPSDVDWTCHHLSWVDRLIYSDFTFWALHWVTRAMRAAGQGVIASYSENTKSPRHHEPLMATRLRTRFLFLEVNVVMFILLNHMENLRRKEERLRLALVQVEEVLACGVFWPGHKLELERDAARLRATLQDISHTKAQFHVVARAVMRVSYGVRA